MYIKDGENQPIRYTTAKIIDNKECAKTYTGEKEIADHMICAIGLKDFCEVNFIHDKLIITNFILIPSFFDCFYIRILMEDRCLYLEALKSARGFKWVSSALEEVQDNILTILNISYVWKLIWIWVIT